MFSSNRTTTFLIGVVVCAPDATAAVAATELPGASLLELAEDTEMPITAAPTAAAVMAPASNLLPACNGAPLFRSRAAVRENPHQRPPPQMRRHPPSLSPPRCGPEVTGR